MLSKKMTVSLTSLITILALAFMAPSAMAGEFDTTLSVTDLSFADGNQVESGSIVVTVAFGKVVKQADIHGKVAITVSNKYGALLTAPAIAAASITPKDLDPADAIMRNDGKTYEITFNITSTPANDNTNPYKAKLRVAKGITAAAIGDADTSKDGDIEIMFVASDPDDSDPTVVSIMAANALLVPDAGFTGDSFDIVITLSEQPKEGKFTKDHLSVDKGTAADPVYLGAVDPDTNGDGDIKDPEVEATGRSGMHHQYLVKITPKAEDGDLVIKTKSFEDQNMPTPNKYMPVTSDLARIPGEDILTVKIKKASAAVKVAGIEVKLLNEGIIPKDGYLVVAKDTGGSAVRGPGDAKKSPVNTERQPFGLTYNLIAGGLPNLETFLINGGTIDLVAPQSLVISEIMWGSDASIADSFKSQYIEIRNTSGAEIKMGDGTHKLVFYGAGATLPDVSTVKDRVGTVGAGGYWSVAGKGQSGRTGVGEAPGDQAAVTPTQALVSMQRVIDATGAAADGTMASSWVASTPPGLNFDPNIEGTRIGSPGRAPVAYPTPPAPEPAPAPAAPVAGASDLMITEIMVDTGDGRLPQWIELTNVSGAEVSLAGWSLMIANSDADADAIGATVSISLSGTLGVGGGTDAGGTMGKSLLLVGGTARSSSNLAGSARVVDISSQVGQKGRYTFISTMAFMAALVPPQTTGILAYGDTAGNLGEGWELPTSDGARSSLIRREMLADGMATMGTDANGWVLASSTSLVSGPATWYGSDEDAGTPGYDAGGPLPVELSHFRPARDDAGAVVITWSTQSELNNAGFFIKRSQQRDGQFKVINATMVAGAGTTSEKQFYTYTDTTAQPNVVYYYQIQDVSLDGNRQTLTRGIRLKGHIGAAGKLTTTWGDLKTSNE